MKAVHSNYSFFFLPSFFFTIRCFRRLFEILRVPLCSDSIQGFQCNRIVSLKISDLTAKSHHFWSHFKRKKWSILLRNISYLYLYTFSVYLYQSCIFIPFFPLLVSNKISEKIFVKQFHYQSHSD